MKKLQTILMFVLAMAIAAPSVYAQEMSRREQKQMEKEIRRDVKEYKKEGWKVAPGDPSMESQVREARKLMAQRDENGYPKYIDGVAMTVGEVYDAALMQANNLSKIRLAENLESRIAELLQTKEANKEISRKDAVSLEQTIAASKSLVAQKIGRVMTPVRLHRELDNGNVEVRLMVFYSEALAMEAMMQTLREELEKESNDLSRKLDEILK